jgi:hypothetical protein
MTIHLTSGGAKPRRVVLSCDVAGCPVQVEPPPAERWRSDSDARTYARSHAAGWTHDPTRGTDYCPDHTEFSTPPVAGVAPPRPTAGIRDSAGNPLNRDDYAAELRKRLAEADSTASGSRTLTPGQAAVVARLLDELAGVYQGEGLGTLAAELSDQLGKPA